MLVDLAEQYPLLVLVDVFDGIEQSSFVIDAGGSVGERPNILGDARSAVPNARIYEVVANAGIGADADPDTFDVGAGRSAIFAISFMNEILVASMALAAYLVSSADRVSMTMKRL